MVSGVVGRVTGGEAVDWYADIIAREVMQAALSGERPADFRGEAAVLDLGQLRASKFAPSPLRSRRTPALIRRGDPERYQLALLRRGATSMSQHRNESCGGSTPSPSTTSATRNSPRPTSRPATASRYAASTFHQLFHGRGEGVQARIRRRRLEQCLADLGRPELGAHRVQSIAARRGFSRSFREAYGISPTEFRARSDKARSVKARSVKGPHRDGAAGPAWPEGTRLGFHRERHDT
ncbi:hypothetical protein [Streptomyces sp. H34-S4]|uniref:hypothetical protein n=1 Tax=Streptomyces sp. H34-S4 TaxID=2996463 RepID=UPI0022708E59|nr:hypothetical protein [Streptomyces sp. H34-S4]MCY0934905.1 hypothetical protein [Streptomyces sp. H34-S4]